MRRGTLLLGLGAALVIVRVAVAQDVAAGASRVRSAPLAPVGTDVCAPPFSGSGCPVPSEWTRECAVRRTATAHRGDVRAEIVADGYPLDLVAFHLVVRHGADAWVLRGLGEEGVGCGTFEMYAASFDLEELAVRDVLAGPEPEVLVRIGGRGDGDAHRLLVCTTEVTPPRCADVIVAPGPVRFRRPDLVVSAGVRTRVDLTGEGERAALP